eukprot:13790929-Alexandrium_andersonii.AAC.1
MCIRDRNRPISPQARGGSSGRRTDGMLRLAIDIGQAAIRAQRPAPGSGLQPPRADTRIDCL